MSDILLSVGMQKGNIGSSQLELDIKEVVSRISKNPPKVKVGLQVDQSAINHFKSQLTQIVNSVSLSGGAPITVSISGIGEITSKANTAKQALDGMAKAGKKAADAVSGMDASKTTPALQDINRQLREIQSNYAKWTAAASGQSKDAYATYGSQIQALESLKAQVRSNTITWEQYKEKLSEIKLVASEAATTISKFGENHSARNVTILEHNTNEYRNALMQCNRELVSLKRNQDQWTAARSGRGAADYAALSSYQYELETLIAQLNTGKMTLDEFNARFTLIKASADNSRLSIRAFGEDTKSLGDRLKGLAEKFGAWLSVSQLIMMAIRSVKQMVSAVRDIDKAMTELKKVTDETSTAYDRFLDKATSRAKRIGASLADVVNASADFARLGYNLQDASNMADAALIYKNIGDGIEDVTTASESIISTMQAFGIEASDVMSIVDKFNEVGNNFAISSAGIGEAMQRSAAAMASANNTIEETIALITAANTIVQNPDSVGTTLKTVSMYLRAAKTEAEEAGESTDGMADSVSELRDELLELTGQRVDIQLDEDTFKSTYQILKELSEVWNDLTDVSKANVLELVGGKRNANIVAALLENFSVAEQALVTASNAAGSAIAENAKQLESIEGKISKFKATFQTFAQNVIGSDLVKNIVDIGTALVTVMDKLQQLHLLLPTIVTAFVAIKSIGAAKGLTSITTALITNKAATDGLAAAVSRLTARQQARLATDIKAAVASGTLTDKEGKQIITTLGLAAADRTLATANHGLATSFKALMASIPVWGWIALAITAVITVVSSLTDAAVKNKQAMIDSANAAVDAYESANNTYQSNISSLENLRARFEQLSQGVDENGERVSLTADEYEEYLSLVQQICNISPSVVQGYDTEGRAIVNYTTLLDDAIESQKEFIDNQRNIYLGNGEDIFDGKAEEYRDAQEKLAKAGEELGNAFNTMGFLETVYDPDRATAIHNAYHDVFTKLGIEFKTGVDTWTTSFDALSQMYEKHDEIIAMLGETGAYTQDELNGISNAIYGLAGAYTSLNAIEGEQVDYLMEWVKDKDWYNAIPLGALDEMRAGIAGVNNPLLSFNDNLSATEQYGKAFADAIQSEAVKSVTDMSSGLSDGSVSIEAYNAAVAGLRDSWGGNADVLPMIVAFLYSLTNGYSSSGDAAETAATKVKTFADAISGDVSTSIDNVQSSIKTLSGALSSLAEGTLGVGDVIDLIQQFPELAGYVNLTAEGFGNLDAGLKQLIKDSPSDVIKTLQEFKEINGLTGEAADQVDNLCDALSSLPTDAIRDASGEFGALAESINNAAKAQTELEKRLAEDDYDEGYEGRVSAYEGFQETIDAGEFGSKAYAAYKDYFGLEDMDSSGVKQWMENNKKYFTEGTEGVLEFMKSIERLGEADSSFKEVATFDGSTGAFWYDPNRLSELAGALEWTDAMAQDFIYKYRMYCEEWESRSPADVMQEFSDAEKIFSIGYEDFGPTFASLKELQDYTGLGKQGVYDLIDSINELRAQEGLPNISLIGRDITEVTQASITQWQNLGATAEEVSALLIDLKKQDVAIAPNLYIDTESGPQIDVDKMLAEAGFDDSQTVQMEVDLVVNNEPAMAVVEFTVGEAKRILGEDWEAKLTANSVDAETGISTVDRLLGELPASTDVLLNDSTGLVRSSLSTVVNLLGNVEDNKTKTVTIRYRTIGIPMFADGTRRAQRGPALLGDEYSPDGSPKPELVVSGNTAYIAGADGPEIGFLNDGDVVYTADQTRRILQGNILHRSIPAHAGGTTPDWDGLNSGGYGGSNTGGGNSSSSSSNNSGDDEESWFERQYKDHQHWLAMDQESVDDYLKWLDEAYQKAYEEGTIDLDEYYKYQEEVYQCVQEQFKDYLNDIEHEISILEAGVGNSDEIINLSLQAIQDIEAELAAAREAGLDENGEYIQWLEQQWMEYNESITNIREEAEADAKDAIDELVDYRIDMLKQEIQDQKDALNKQLDDLKDFYDKQRKMLQDQYDEEKYLEEQNEKRKSVTDLRAELAMLESDDSAWAHKRKLELQAELSDAEKELSSFEKDHALDMTLDMLDEQQAAQEAQIQAQMDALDEKLNDPHALFNQALEDIKNNTEELYQQFIEYNRKHGTGNDQDIADMWEDAYKADLEYQETHNGEHQDGVEIGNYTGYVVPENSTPPQSESETEQPTYDNEPEKSYPYGKASDTSGNIGVGVSGDKVRAIQYALNELGFGNSGTQGCDGQFGLGTQSAVMAFQHAMGISPDGIVGENTRAKFKAQGYASGTSNATPGWHELFEGGLDEYVFTSSDGNKYKMFSGLGDKVLNGKATEFLYDFANSGGSVLTKMLSSIFGIGNLGNISKPIQAVEIHAGDIIVQGNATERTVSEIRRAQRESLDFVIKEFNKLNK